MLNFLLAIIGFLVIRYIGKSGLIKFALTGQTVAEMRTAPSFHVYFVGYLLGTIGFYATLTFALAVLVKQLFL